MKRRLHAAIASFALLLIASFLVATVTAETVGGTQHVAMVKNLIVTPGLWLLIPCLMATGGSGFLLAKRGNHPYINAKKRRMPIIALNGLLILVPCALYLQQAAISGRYDGLFYAVQLLELIAGSINLSLMTLNWLDGWRLHARYRRKSVMA